MRVVTNMLDSVDRFGERTVSPWRLRPAVDLAATYAAWAGEGAAIWFGWGALRLAIDQRIEQCAVCRRHGPAFDLTDAVGEERQRPLARGHA